MSDDRGPDAFGDQSWVAARCAEIAVRGEQGLDAALARLTAAAAAAPDEVSAGELAVRLTAEHGIWIPTA